MQEQKWTIPEPKPRFMYLRNRSGVIEAIIASKRVRTFDEVDDPQGGTVRAAMAVCHHELDKFEQDHGEFVAAQRLNHPRKKQVYSVLYTQGPNSSVNYNLVKQVAVDMQGQIAAARNHHLPWAKAVHDAALLWLHRHPRKPAA